MVCLVCGAPEAEPHFGAISCRACAAFFRRYYHSTKAIVSCTCSQRVKNSHPCRECRMKKCLAIGMEESRIQLQREKHPKKSRSCQSKSKAKRVEFDFEFEPSTSTSPISLPSLENRSPRQLSLLSCRLTPQDSPHISSKTVQFLPSYSQKRNELYGGNWRKWNLHGLTSYVKRDSESFWNLISDMFPQVLDLKPFDKDSLLSNFVPKWFSLEPAIDFSRNEEVWKDPTIPVEDSLVSYYTFDGDMVLSRGETIRTFGQFWVYYFGNVILPISSQDFDDKEFMAIILLLFFDNAHSNLTEKCGQMCRDIRKVILRELRAYQTDISDDNEADRRFLSTVEVLSLIEKGERKLQEEMLVCQMHHVRIHEDFLEMIRRNNL